MYFKLGRYSKAFILWSLVALVLVSQLHPLAVGSVLFTLLCFFYRNKLKLGRRGAGVVVAVSLLMCYGCTRILSYDDSGMFLGIGTFSLTLLACWLLGFSLLAQLKGYAQRAPLGFAAALLIGCSMTIYIKVVMLVAVPAVVLFCLALREALSLMPSARRLLLPLLTTGLVMSGLAGAATWSESRLSYLMGLFSLLPPAGYTFPTATSLSALQRWNNSDIVVLRGYGTDPPLYLVGRTFSEFDDKNFWRWNTTKQELAPVEQMLVETRTGPRAVSVFDRAGSEAERGSPFRLEYPKPANGLTLYYPRYYYAVAADIGRLHHFSDGMLQALAMDRLDAEYFVIPFKQGWDNRETPEPLSEEEREMYLQLPDNLTPEVARLAEEVAAAAANERQKADFVTTYFQQNFTYGYDFPFQSTQTALEEFLLKRPPAHCEFFATAAALLLRSQGVPTRYINGFVLQEKSLLGDYYVIRLKHAHAWIEAYLPGEGWVTYDPTPAGTLGSPEDTTGLSQSFAELASNFWRRFSNFFSLSPAEMLGELKTFVRGLTVGDYLKLLSLLLLWGVWKRYRKRRPKTKKAPLRYSYKPGRLEGITPLWERLERAVPDEWCRRPAETPVAWVERLRESSPDPDLLGRLESFASDYTRLRFRTGDQESELVRLGEVVGKLEAELLRRTKGNSGK
ncbi:MAG: transglutaminase domain-containing protein [Vulcanimicrobiota bacterium]